MRSAKNAHIQANAHGGRKREDDESWLGPWKLLFMRLCVCLVSLLTLRHNQLGAFIL